MRKKLLSLVILTLLLCNLISVFNVYAADELALYMLEDFEDVPAAGLADNGAVKTWLEGKGWSTQYIGTANFTGSVTAETESDNNNRLKIDAAAINDLLYMQHSLTDALAGRVEIQFDMEVSPSGWYAWNILEVYSGKNSVASLSWGYDNFLYRGYKMDYGKVGAKWTTDACRKTVIITIDTNTDTYTARLAGGENLAEISLNSEIDYIDSIKFKFQSANNNTGVLAIDNVLIKQLNGGDAKLSWSSVENGDVGVSRTNAIDLQFAEKMDADSLSNITLHKENATGETVEVVGAQANDYSYSITPKTALDPATRYAVVIPNTVKTKLGASAVPSTITFATRKDDIKTEISEDFNRISSTATPFEIDTAITSGKFSGFEYKLTKGDYSANASSNTEGALDSYITDTEKIYVKDGKLNIVASASPQYFRDINFQYPDVNSGIVQTSFDVEFAKTPGYQPFVRLQGAGVGVGVGNVWSDWRVSSGSKSSSVDNDAAVVFAPTIVDGVNHVILVNDITNGTGYVIINGVKSPTIASSAMTIARLVHFEVTKGQAIDIAIDNLSVKTLNEAKIESVNIANGETGVSTVYSPVIKFNAPISSDELSKIKLYKAGEEVTGIEMVQLADGYGCRLQLTAPLDSETFYTIEIPSLMTVDGLYTDAATYSYQTAEEVETDSDLFVSNYSVKDGNGDNLLAVSAGTNIVVDAKYTNAGNEECKDAVLVVGLYDSSSALQKMFVGNADVAANGTADLSVNFTVPSNIGSGAYIRLFTWESFDSLKPLGETIIFPEA